MDLKFDLENPAYEHVTTEDHLNKVLEKLEKERVVGADVETTELDPYTSTLLTVQIGTDKISYVFDLENPAYEHVTTEDHLNKVLEKIGKRTCCWGGR